MIDAYDDLAQTLRGTEGAEPQERWKAFARAYRTWALAGQLRLEDIDPARFADRTPLRID